MKTETSDSRLRPKPHRRRLPVRMTRTLLSTAAIGCGVTIAISKLNTTRTGAVSHRSAAAGSGGEPPRIEQVATTSMTQAAVAAQRASQARSSTRTSKRDQQEAVPPEVAFGVPTALLAHLKVPAFQAAAADQPLSLSEEMRAVLGIDGGTAARLEQLLRQNHSQASESRWGAAQVYRGDRKTVVDVSPESSDAGARRLAELRSELTAVLGEERAAFFLSRAKENLDWEFGGFGAYSTVIEVTPHGGGYWVRESLRRPVGSAPSGMENWQAEVFQEFEFAVKEYRTELLPERLERILSSEA